MLNSWFIFWIDTNDFALIALLLYKCSEIAMKLFKVKNGMNKSCNSVHLFSFSGENVKSVVTESEENKSASDRITKETVAAPGSSTTTSDAESNPSTPIFSEELKVASCLRKFTFNGLKVATRNFRPESLLGEGGFGCVFKGWIEENGTAPVKPGTGLTVAVKTLNHNGHQGHKEWLVWNLYILLNFHIFIFVVGIVHMLLTFSICLCFFSGWVKLSWWSCPSKSC